MDEKCERSSKARYKTEDYVRLEGLLKAKGNEQDRLDTVLHDMFTECIRIVNVELGLK